MNFDLSDDQKMLVDTARSFVKKELTIARSRKLREDERGWSKATWKQLGELGWLALPFSEEAGGLGSHFSDTALVLEQLGTTLVPEPILASCVYAGWVLQRLGTKAQWDSYLAPMIAGDTSLALAVTERASRYDPTHTDTKAEKNGDKWLLRGEKVWVLNGHVADHLIVSTRTENGLSAFILPANGKGVTIKRVSTMDQRSAAFITFDKAEAEMLGAEGQAGDALQEAFDRAAAAACAAASGMLGAVLAMTVEYLGLREQFGVKIGTFQALQHRAVDMFIETELSKSMMILAALKVDDEPAERAYQISQAKIQMGVSGRFVTQSATQLLGGIGVTEEHDVGLYFKRMHILSMLFGAEEFHITRMMHSPSFHPSLAASTEA